MNDLEKKSIECIKNMPIEETTYQVARNVVLDYITNLQHTEDLYNQLLKDYDELQQENERLKEKSINEVLKNDFDMCVKDLKKANKKIEKLDDYKSRIEKAVEYIKVNNSEWKWSMFGRDDLLNILNGRSDE